MSKHPGNKKAKKAVVMEDLPYRPCVGIALFNAEGRVWVGRRSDVDAEDDAAAPLFDIMVQQMDYCPLEALEEN